MNRITLRTVVLVALVGILASVAMADKIKIEKLDDLPRHTYKIEMTAIEFIDNDEALLNLAHQLKADIEDDLAKYEIPDKTTVKGYYGMLGSIAILDGQHDAYLEFYGKMTQLEDKESSRLTAGLLSRSVVAAAASGEEVTIEAVKREYAALVNPLPYAVVGADLESNKARSEMIGRNLIIGMAESRIQPVLDQTGGEVSKDVAHQLVLFGYTLRHFIPYKAMIAEVLTDYLAANTVVKDDIWADRDVTLNDGDGKGPVTVCIWDSGSDTDVFTDKLWTNTNEVAGNGADDDNNGFIDDVHGIAYTLHSDKTPELLYPIGDVGSDRPRLQRLMKGLTDMQANIDSEEASEIKKTLSTLQPGEVQTFIEDISRYGNCAHGTHVAGIALRDNPYARLMTSRLTFDYRLIGEEPTLEQARKDSLATAETVKYFKDNGARVVNMSWGGSLAGIESGLEEHNAGGTPEERKALAREIFEIGKAALLEAFKSAPEILFITSAGNSNNDVSFEEFLPSGLNLPNLMSVGAVDQSGDETGFTSFGKVDIYANGFNVLSYVPGGDEMKLSGTSQASPQVTNLAAKLLAVRPDLTPAQLRRLIVDGADAKVSGEREVILMNPTKTFELLAQMK